MASEELEPEHGWDYAAIFSAIRSNPAISGSSLGRVIADGYRAQAIAQGTALRAQGNAYNQDQAITLSVVDLSRLSPIIAALEALTTAAGTDIRTSGQSARIQLAAGRSRAEDYGNDEQNKSYLDLADVKHLASQLATTYPSETSSLIAALDSAVVYKISGSARPNANGLSLFFPHKNINNPTLSVMVQAYNALNFSEIYQTFVGQYVTLGDQDATAPAFAGEAFDGTVLSGQVQGGDVDSVYAVITQTDPGTGTVLIIGIDTVDTQDAAGNVTYAWDGQWLTLNGEFVSVYPDSIGGTIETYLIPALLNGQGVDILVKVDTTTDEIVVLGAWPGIVNGVAAREILPIEAGDVITPTFFLYDVTRETTQEVAGTPFAVGASGVELGIGPLPAGSYYLGFLATDYAQNDQNSQFFAVNVSSESPVQPPSQPSLGTWTSKPPMPTPRRSLAAGVVNGTLYAVGGVGQTATCCNQLQTVEAYNPIANTWTTMAPMPTGREGLAAGVVNGILYAVGGWNGTKTIEAYDPIANVWVTKTPMPTERAYPAIGVVNGILYVVGGLGFSGGAYVPLATVDAYDPVTNTWTAKAPMSTARFMLGAGVVNGVLYAVGGNTNNIGCCGVTDVVEAYDPVTNTWTVKAQMPTPRYGLTVGMINGTIYAVGGVDDRVDPGSPAIRLATVEAYDPVTNAWSTKTPLPSERFWLASGVLNDMLYALGGSAEVMGSLTVVGTMEVFAP